MTHRGYLSGQTRITDTLTYDNENRLTDITFGNGNPSAEYYYNGGGARIITKVGTNVTLYIGGIGEYSLGGGGLFTKYYYVGSQRITMKTSSGTLHFFANDHLATTPTRRRYTGQIQDFDKPSMDLYFYNARYYDPVLARFTQADTIVPNLGNPQSLNRFSYVQNNPLRLLIPQDMMKQIRSIM